MNITKQEEKNEELLELVSNLTLLDDDLMSRVFHGNKEAAELLINTILSRDDIRVISVVGQESVKNSNVNGRDVVLDMLVEDSRGKCYNIEVQRDRKGANARRARFHSAIMDARMLREGQKFKELRDSYTIFITQNDYFKKGLPVYTVNRYVEETRQPFLDGSHILYINASYDKDDAIGRLMHDFRCKDTKAFNYAVLAEGVRHFKEEKEDDGMCEAVEKFVMKWGKEYGKEYAKEYAKEYVIRAAIEANIECGANKEDIIVRICNKYGCLPEEAEALYDDCMGKK